MREGRREEKGKRREGRRGDEMRGKRRGDEIRGKRRGEGNYEEREKRERRGK